MLKHPISGRSPIPVAELITSDHTVLSISFYLEAFRRAEGLLFGTCRKHDKTPLSYH